MMSVASMGLRPGLHTSLRKLNVCLERSFTSYRPVIRAPLDFERRLPTRCVCHNSASPTPKLNLFVGGQGFKHLNSGLRVSSSNLKWSGLWKKDSPLCTQAFGHSEKSGMSSDDIPSKGDKKEVNFLLKGLWNLVKGLAALFISVILLAGAVPSLLTLSSTRKAALFLANMAIPGTVSVSSMSLGWTKPVHVDGFVLQGTDNENVISIQRIETKASLLSIIRGKSGFGDCSITSPVIDLQQHPENNLPRIALALTSAEKLLEKTGNKKPVNKEGVPPGNVALTVQAKSPDGDLEVTNGTIIFPSDVAAVLGDKLAVNVDLGLWATNKNDELKNAEATSEGVPLLASVKSDTVQMLAVGFLHKEAKKIKLMKPLKAEMELTPKVAQFYLARVNPLLGEIVGPAIQHDDIPDVVVDVTPTNLELPSEHYKINIAPMKVTLARGQLVDGVLSLLSKQDLAKGKRSLTMQTSVVEANVQMPSTVESSRLDILIADKVHIATWGSLDWIDETVQMTLAVPPDTLKNLVGLTKIAADNYLKVSVTGTLAKPVVDWKSAGLSIAELTARQRGGQFMQGLLDKYHSKDRSKADPTPEPIAVLPWEMRAAK